MNDLDDQSNRDHRSDVFVRRVRHASDTVFGSTPLGNDIDDLCHQHTEARNAIIQDRSDGATVVAVVGATGQGKSWLVQQLIQRSSVGNQIRSGNNSDDATEKLIWIGPRPPADLDPRHERFISCPANQMQSIGIPYLIVDSPGATDDRRAIAGVAQRALSMASVLLVVVRRDQMRSQIISVLTDASEGTLVIPVINAVRHRDASLQTDIDALLTRMRDAAPNSQIVQPVVIDDCELVQDSEPNVGHIAAEEVAARLKQALQDSWEGDRRRSTRLAALETRFRAALQSLLHDQLPGLTDAVQSLHRETLEIPGDVAETLLGSQGSLRAAIRSRLRLQLMEDTSPIWFPYRSLLGLLNLTNGAWDRLLLSLSGSLPSLVGTIWTGARNVANGNSAAGVREGLLRRSSAAINDRLRPLANRFRDELATLRHESLIASRQRDDDLDRPNIASLDGLNTLQEESQQIFESSISQAALSRGLTFLFGLLATIIFWSLMSGPVIALYDGYLKASFGTITGTGSGLDAFPRPDASMMITSVMLSILPTALFSMIVVSISQSRNRVMLAQQSIRERHHETIERLHRDGVLRLSWSDPVLADAEFLLSINVEQHSPLRNTLP